MIRLLSHSAAPVLELPRSVKRIIVVSADISLCFITAWLSFYFRLGEFLPLSSGLFSPLFLTAGVSVAFAIPVFVASGLYRAIFRYSGLPAMTAMVRAMLLYGVFFAGLFTFYGVQGVPRTVGLI